MGFNSVYRVLQNLFPQVDTRLLRAVAIENSKDADAAVEVVLMEIIPYLSKVAVEDACPGPAKDTLRVDSPYSDKTSNGSSDSKTSGDHDQVYRDDEIEEPASVGKPEKSNVEVGPDVTSVVMPIITVYENGAEDHCNGVDTKSHEINSLEESSSVKVGSDQGSHSNTISGHDQVYRDDGNGELGSVGKHEKSNVDGGADVTSLVPSLATVFANGADDPCSHLNTESQEINSLRESSNVKVGSDQSSQVSSTTSKRRCGCTNGITSRNQVTDSEDFDWPSACGCDVVVLGESQQEQSPVDVEISVVQWTPSNVQDCIPDAPEGSLQLAVLQQSNGDYETPESSGASDDASKNDVSSGEMVDFVDDSALNAAITRSGQICRIDLLEDIIEDARNNKKTLFSAMESVISLMRELELQEKAAELAKEEAVRGGLDMHSRVEDLKQMLQHAKEANNMHAGEVYGEKAILSTEVKELQSRLLSLSDERDKSLAILDEMRQTIEERLDAAEKTRNAAEQEKMEKEESARTALAEQELVMEKVVQESKMLKQEAEENSKLQEFLMDRGRVVDMLQGEISVICQDVKLLKEKFDERVPLSKSLSSSQTSCILASSSSSLKSMLPDQVPEQADSSETPKKSSPSASVDEQLSSGGGEREGGDRKELVDDGWEFFENREFDL